MSVGARLAAADFFPALALRSEWRTYQRTILDQFDHRDPAKRTFHVVAPPGSGKTLVGIEIARRIGRPAVTFSPTTTIQEQWREKVRLFLPEGAEGERLLRAGVSTDPADLAALSCLTYQSLSTQTQAHEFLDRIGRAAWVDELVAGGKTPEGAEAYLADLAAKVPDEVERGIASRASRRKRELLASGQATLADLLHPNALALVDRLVAAGTGCIVLDEAHHLLDYWAAILAHLVERLPEAVVVGLTATPPASAGPDELANYLALVDGIDFEVPTPAVVRSGHLAPYQDLVQVVEPTPDERSFLEHEDRVLDEAIAGVFADPRFPGHVETRVNRPGGTPTWDQLVSEDFELAVAGVRYLTEAGRALAPDVHAPPEMLGPLHPRDRLALVRDWCLGFLRVSPDARDRAALADLRQALRTLGMVMTDAGWRPAPSPLDRILAYSSAKVEAMVRILRAEQASMGDRVRAVVLTDFETSSALSLRRLKGVLDPESGGAVRAVRAIVRDPEAGRLDPIMVTGRTVLADADLAGRLAEELTTRFEREGVRATVRTEDAGDGLVAVDGDGPDWAPRAWVPAVTELFERGVTRCIVGTRGLLSEGWDSLSLNTLVDLTTAGTYASVNQIRGRSIRLDPNDPRKVANNWDVVCVAPKLRGGWRDLERLAAKHGHVWGLGPQGRIVRGIGHVDPRLVLLPANRGGRGAGRRDAGVGVRRQPAGDGSGPAPRRRLRGVGGGPAVRELRVPGNDPRPLAGVHPDRVHLGALAQGPSQPAGRQHPAVAHRVRLRLPSVPRGRRVPGLAARRGRRVPRRDDRGERPHRAPLRARRVHRPPGRLVPAGLRAGRGRGAARDRPRSGLTGSGTGDRDRDGLVRGPPRRRRPRGVGYVRRRVPGAVRADHRPALPGRTG